MSKGLSYFLGVVTGILLTFGFLAVRAYTAKESGKGEMKTEKQAKLPDGVTMLETPVPFTEAKTLRFCRSFSTTLLSLSQNKSILIQVLFTIATLSCY